MGAVSLGADLDHLTSLGFDRSGRLFWRDVTALRRHLVPEAADIELRAQVERALAAGLRPTHLDAHMAAAMLPELLDCHVALAREYRLVPVLPRLIRFAPDPSSYLRAVAALETLGLPLPDAFRGTLAVPEHEVRQGYWAMIEGLPLGVTHVALHCTAPGEIEVIAPEHAPWRIREYRLLNEGAVREWCRSAQVLPIGYREVGNAYCV